ncbi:MAG TPA: glycine cleavage T C-terminal barrel domain-containing protein [Micropepsaceae bacterium]|jgi:aminomethyltransferase
MKELLLSTPFHARTAEHNRANVWVPSDAYTVPAHYGDSRRESLAARCTAALIDVSATQDLSIAGEGAAALLSAVCGPAVRGIAIGHSQILHWCADRGGLRGFGVMSRLAEDGFLLRSTDADIGWFAAAAARFQTRVRDATAERGLLLLTGPYAVAVMVAARLEILPLEAMRHGSFDWRGIAVRVFHRAHPDGYEISVAPEDAALAFDRLTRAGRLVSLRLAGEDALQLLQLEAGVPLAYRDFAPAREAFACAPSPAALGFTASEGMGEGAGALVLAGLELESDRPMPFAPVVAGPRDAGRTLRSLYSPSLKAAIALAELAPQHAAPGTAVTVRRGERFSEVDVRARVVALPFL